MGNLGFLVIWELAAFYFWYSINVCVSANWCWLLFLLVMLCVDQICLASKDCFSGLRRLPCCFTTSAYTIFVLLGMRSITWFTWAQFFMLLTISLFLHSFNGHHYSQSFLSCIFMRVLAVGICSDMSRWSCSFCWWLSRSDPCSSQLLWVWCYNVVDFSFGLSDMFHFSNMKSSTNIIKCIFFFLWHWLLFPEIYTCEVLCHL